MICRHCKTSLTHLFIDLGAAPPSNAYLSEPDLHRPELTFPLRLYWCHCCGLVQTEDYAGADELFSHDYAYFSSISSSWLEHAASYVSMITEKLSLSASSLVMEIASNDGYLLKNFVAASIPCLGIEPTASTAAAAEQLGIPVLREFFGVALAKRLAAEGRQADLIVGNNVYAHVPDINDFTAGLAIALKPGGTITLEFPHLLRLIEQTQFDTVYHEHFSYLSLTSVTRIFADHGLKVVDVEQLSTHGGSLRVYGVHNCATTERSSSVDLVLKAEEQGGLLEPATYTSFQQRANKVKDDLLSFLMEQKRNRKVVAGYGAAAKGNTLLNYAGIRADLLPFVCDAAPSKQGKYLPGSRIPIMAPEALQEHKPDFVLILPWNIADEVLQQYNYIAEWGGRFVTAVPEIKIY